MPQWPWLLQYRRRQRVGSWVVGKKRPLHVFLSRGSGGFWSVLMIRGQGHLIRFRLCHAKSGRDYSKPRGPCRKRCSNLTATLKRYS
jgi:hypothetical protein